MPNTPLPPETYRFTQGIDRSCQIRYGWTISFRPARDDEEAPYVLITTNGLTGTLTLSDAVLARTAPKPSYQLLEAVFDHDDLKAIQKLPAPKMEQFHGFWVPSTHAAHLRECLLCAIEFGAPHTKQTFIVTTTTVV